MTILNGRVAIVTGAALGPKASLGSCFARRLAAAGARVVLADVVDCGSVVDEIVDAGGSAVAVKADVKSEDSVKALVARAIEWGGAIDILVNNAAVGSNTPPVSLEDISVAEWDESFAVNVRGAFLCVKHCVPYMRARGYGKVVNLSSTMWYLGMADRLHYVTGKGALVALTRAMARELGPHGIRVNALSFGGITSRLNEERMKDDAAYRDAIIGPRAIKIHVREDDVAEAMLFLVSPQSDATTGQVMMVDPGSVHI